MKHNSARDIRGRRAQVAVGVAADVEVHGRVDDGATAADGEVDDGELGDAQHLGHVADEVRRLRRLARTVDDVVEPAVVGRRQDRAPRVVDAGREFVSQGW